MSATIGILAHDLAVDAIETATALGEEELIVDIGNNLASFSTTVEEAFRTAARVRMSIIRACKLLDSRINAAAAKLDSK